MARTVLNKARGRESHGDLSCLSKGQGVLGEKVWKCEHPGSTEGLCVKGH